MWADGVPNLLIGLREGLEGGLVVSILLAAVRRTDPRSAAGAVWVGVAAAVALALSFGAVLTFSESAMSTVAREAFGGSLSVIAVVLVTGMIFWMRRAARSLSGELRAKVDDALRVGGAALALTAFLAVAREGLETALFLWTTVQASGHSVAPLLGALVGVTVSVALCWLLYRRAVKINLGTFFSRTAVLLVIIAAGVLAYGLGELQSTGLLPGHTWMAFDFSRRLSIDTWWVAIASGVTNLRPAMTWLQVVAYVGYLAVVMVVLRRSAQPATARTPATAPQADRAPEPGSAGTVDETATAVTRPAWVRGRVRAAVAAAVVVPVLAAAVLIAALPHGAAQGLQIEITSAECAPGWRPVPAGPHSFTVVNNSGHSGEVYLVDAAGGIVGELEGLGPGTRQSMPATLAAGEYTWRCLMAGQPVRTSAVARATGGSTQAATAVTPVSGKDLEGPVAAYRTYVTSKLTDLAGQVTTLRSAITAGDLAAARSDWLAAQLTWEQVGAAYSSFGDLGDAIGGLPAGLPQGVNDPAFTGLHRIEYGLWHGQTGETLLLLVDKLAGDLTKLRDTLPQVTMDPADLPLRAHEILEDALRDHLTGAADQGSGAGFAETAADLQGTRVVLDELAPLITARRPDLLSAAAPQMDALDRALQTAHRDGAWSGVTAASLATRQQVNAAVGALLETLAPVPDLLEVRGP